VCRAQLRFGTALAALSVLRYMTDYMTELPLGVMARMLDTHDSIMQLVPLLEERPWMRRCARPAHPVPRFQHQYLEPSSGNPASAGVPFDRDVFEGGGDPSNERLRSETQQRPHPGCCGAG
jgi:hypothetical protein